MAHEKEKAQYEEDCKKYGEKAYKLWEFDSSGSGYYVDIDREPGWYSGVKYRRKKEAAFQPKYFSALNKDDASNLIGRFVEGNNNPHINDWKKGILICTYTDYPHFGLKCNLLSHILYEYIRTCPETFKHPTITIGGVELPRPETEAPEKGTKYWIFDSRAPASQICQNWCNDDYDIRWLKSGSIHLTEDRKKAWEDWWENTVINQIRG